MPLSIKSLIAVSSHPHGCVSWNKPIYLIKSFCFSHTLTGVWVEIFVVPDSWQWNMSHPHGCVSWNSIAPGVLRDSRIVTPSRVCELKLIYCWIIQQFPSHTLTGVWVEMTYSHWSKSNLFCHTLTGVWVEILYRKYKVWHHTCHTLTGVWVEIQVNFFVTEPNCGHTLTGVWVEISNLSRRHKYISHTLTGVWVEMYLFAVVG